jgi:hypothetical protein
MQSRRQTTFMDRPAHRRTSPATHLAEILCAHNLIFVVVVVVVVILCEILETYVCECWRLVFVSELV